MKLLLLPLLLFLGGAGGYGLAGAADTPAHAQVCSDCRIEVECTDRGTCVVTCFDAAGDILCQQEVDCDEPCEAPCAPAACCAR